METMQTIRLWFKKEGLAKYISHLDLVKSLQIQLYRTKVSCNRQFGVTDIVHDLLFIILIRKSSCQVLTVVNTVKDHRKKIARKADL